jgi:hypothetical protein
VSAKRPFAGPEQVLRYLARYTHRVAIANSRLIAFDGARVSFKVKDYRKDGAARYGSMTLDVSEFIRRFLLHVLPDGFHRIRHVGFLANGVRAEALAKARAALNVAPSPSPQPTSDPAAEPEPPLIATCRCCGGRLVLIETLPRPPRFQSAPLAPEPIDSS